MKTIFNSILLMILAVSVSSCFDKDRPNYQYMDNMYEPIGYEAYGEYDVFENEQEAKLPAEGSVPRGWQPYDYEDTLEGKEKATMELKNPLPYTSENLDAGKELYTIYCAVCHGDKGDGKGILAQREKILGVPAYNAPGRIITEGDVYHVMYYGLNTMGSYAAQVNEKERWQIVHQVMKLQDALNGLPERKTVEIEDTATNQAQPSTSETAQMKTAELEETESESTEQQ